MNHAKIVLQILVLFFSCGTYANAVCTLLEKDVPKRKYSFRCDNKTINVQCEDEDKFLCGVTIKDAFETMKFNLTDDQFNAFDLFSTAELAKTECDSVKKLCWRDANTCKKYQKYFRKVETVAADESQSKRCNYLDLGDSVKAMGAFSGGLTSDFKFDKNSCGVNTEVPFTSLKRKISLFKKVLEPPFKQRSSLLYRCVSLPLNTTIEEQDRFVASKVGLLQELKNRIYSRLDSTTDLKQLICGPQSSIFFANGKLDVDTVTCAIFEESALSMNNSSIVCGGDVGDPIDGETDGAFHREASAALAKVDSVPLEQKPMPEIMASQVGKPIGLTLSKANSFKGLSLYSETLLGQRRRIKAWESFTVINGMDKWQSSCSGTEPSITRV